MVFDAQNGPQLVIRGISTALKMLNLPQKHPFFTFEAKKPLKQHVGAHFEHQKSFIYIKTWFFVLWLYSNSFNEGPTPYGIKRANLLCRPMMPIHLEGRPHFFVVSTEVEDIGGGKMSSSLPATSGCCSRAWAK